MLESNNEPTTANCNNIGCSSPCTDESHSIQGAGHLVNSTSKYMNNINNICDSNRSGSVHDWLRHSAYKPMGTKMMSLRRKLDDLWVGRTDLRKCNSKLLSRVNARGYVLLARVDEDEESNEKETHQMIYECAGSDYEGGTQVVWAIVSPWNTKLLSWYLICSCFNSVHSQLLSLRLSVGCWRTIKELISAFIFYIWCSIGDHKIE